MQTVQLGSNEAKYHLAVHLSGSLGIPHADKEQAIRLNIESAIAGNSIAMITSVLRDKYGGFSKSQLDDALEQVKKLAEEGNPFAQYRLGICYQLGEFVEVNYEKAREHYLRSATQGHSTAQYNLGVLYLDGLGIHTDYVEAFKWFSTASNKGYANAQCNLAWMYDNGKGMEANHTEAFKWYMKSAEQNHATSEYNIGLLYSVGRAVEMDLQKTIHWWIRAANHGEKEAMSELAHMYWRGYLNEYKDIKGYTVEIDRQKAVDFYRMGCESGNVDCIYKYARILEKGEYVKRDLKYAMECYNRAITKKHFKAKIRHQDLSLRMQFWNEIRLLWIGNRKEGSWCPFASIPKELIREIIYPMRDQLREERSKVASQKNDLDSDYQDLVS